MDSGDLDTTYSEGKESMNDTVNCYNSFNSPLLLAGEYSCLRVKLLFARQLSFFLVTVYVPCSMTVSVSWMSFWLDHKAVSDKLSHI